MRKQSKSNWLSWSNRYGYRVVDFGFSDGVYPRQRSTADYLNTDKYRGGIGCFKYGHLWEKINEYYRFYGQR